MSDHTKLYLVCENKCLVEYSVSDIDMSKIETGVLPISHGGTGSSNIANAPANAIIKKFADSNQLWYTATKKGAFYATEENGAPTFGTLPISLGGMGRDFSNVPPYAIIRAPSDTDKYPYIYYTATGNGAFYATAENGDPKFGTLPIAQGGTGATSAANARTNLGAAAKEHSHGAGDISSGTLSSDRLPVVPMSKGGLGTSIDIVNAPANAILKRLKTDAYDQIFYERTGNGAFYATKQDGDPQFGTLPIAQGGTGATTAAGALAALGAFSMKLLWTNESPSSSFEGQTLTITGLSNYNVFIIVCARNTSTSYQSSVVMYVPKTDETYGCISEASVSTSGTSVSRQRNVFVTRSANTVQFSTGWMTGSASGNTDVLIPLYILGAKI